jgi:hypothetical protein
MALLALWVTGVNHGSAWLLGGIVVMGALASAAAFPPGSLSLPTRLASIFALGYTTLGLISSALVIVHHLTPETYVIGVVVVGVLLSLVALKRGGIPHRATAAWSELRRWSWELSAGLIALSALALTRPSGLLEYGSSSAWRYWADAAQIADSGRVPGQTPQWGTTFPFTVSKALMNAFNAGADYLIGSNLAANIWVLSWFPVVGWAIALWAVGWELGLRRTAPLLAVAGAVAITLPGGFTANAEMARDFQQFKAENIGRMVAFSALALAIRQVRSGGTTVDAVIVGLLFAAAATTHLVPTFVAIAFLVGVLLATVAERRSIPVSFRSMAAGIATLVVLAGALPVLSGGDIGFEGASGTYKPFHAPGQNKDLDPTAAFIHHFVPFPTPAIRWQTAPRSILTDAVDQAVGVKNPSAVWIAAVSIVLIAVALLLPGRSVGAVGGSFVLALALVGGAIVFAFRYHTVVPGGFGEKRLFDYIDLPLIVLACCVLESALHNLERISATLTRPVALLLALGAVAFMLSSQSTPSNPSAAAVAQYERTMSILRSTTPCGARVLFNFRTTGSVQLLAHRVAILEGMAPYLRPALLNSTLVTLYGARTFLAAPQDHAEYLTTHHINYVVVATGQNIVEAIRQAGMAVNLPQLKALPNLQLVSSQPGLLVFGVRDQVTNSSLIYPGYGC